MHDRCKLISGFVVIGGQYKWYTYGVYHSLHQAKVMASKHTELWDNWQGFRTPRIFPLEDCDFVPAFVDDTGNYHPDCYLPRLDARCWSKSDDGKWYFIVDGYPI